MPTSSVQSPSLSRSRVHRVEVAPAPGQSDPIGRALMRDAAALGISLTAARATHVYLIQPHPDAPIDRAQLDAICQKLLADPITEVAAVGAAPVTTGSHVIEVHPLPGVMDPVAESVQAAIKDVLDLPTAPEIATGWRYDLSGPGLTSASVQTLAQRLLANPVIQRVHTAPYHPDHFPVSQSHEGGVREVRLTHLSDAELEKLSRDAHLFLSLDEMKAVRDHYRAAGREPREIELETLAQTWSEHCVHKTLKSTIRYRAASIASNTRESREAGGALSAIEGRVAHPDPIFSTPRPGHEHQPDGTVIIHNLLKSTVAAATKKLIADGLDWTLSVFVDNSGVIAFDDEHAVCIKVETHNRPSAIEPYGGAATGVGGCIRDVIGTGLGARPIASTDVFCVAHPATTDIPEGCLHPRRILTQVVAGVRDYGNRMGIPTVAGGVYFDNRYVGNPLVYCGCIGVMPRSCVKGEVREGDLIVALGGRTGRDGIHGATFSSAEISHTAADEFAHAVQIGNAITEKQVLDAILRARDEHSAPLYHAMTDCGAGGFSSAVGEMGKSTGATVHLDKAPLKYAGLSATEIWISEAQERMVLAVPEKNLRTLQSICDEEGVDLAVLGTFAPPPGSKPNNPDLLLLHNQREVGRLNMHFLHEGIPTPTREAIWIPRVSSSPSSSPPPPSSSSSLRHSVTSSLLQLLSHPTIASKHWIIRQYDHEVRAGTAVKPLVGPLTRGPSDASVIMPVPGSHRGLAVSSGLQTGIGDPALAGDPYQMTLAAIDECVRNLVCVGADPSRIAILDNFCWPSCKKPENLGALVRACEACYDGALAYQTPFVSGKDSLHNEFTTRDGRTIAIPPTLLITGMGIVPDVRRACTMDAKSPGNILVLVGETQDALAGSIFAQLSGTGVSRVLSTFPTTNLATGPRTARAVASLIASGLVRSAHDVSDGGALVAIAEMLIAGSSPEQPIGATIDLGAIAGVSREAGAFGESPSRYILEIDPAALSRVRSALADIPLTPLGSLTASGELHVGGDRISVEELAKAWLMPLDW